VILVNGSVNKTITKLDGLKGTDVLSISCKNGLWVLSGGCPTALQKREVLHGGLNSL